MIQRDIRIKLDTGLQSKLLAKFIQKASSFSSSIWIEKDEKKANAKSMLGILALGIVEPTDIAIIADGVDEENAISELEEFILSNA